MRFSALSLAAVLTMSAASASAGLFGIDECKYKEARHLTTPASGVTKVVIHADSGSLTVDGRSGLAQIAADGTACTTEEDFLSKMTLTARKQGTELHITAVVPSATVWFGFFNATLDFTVAVPAGIPIDIQDDSGWIKTSNTGTLWIDDDSGSIEVHNVRGDLRIDDDSGSITVDDVAGNVKITDDSGSIEVANVSGSVMIDDDSGSIDARHVKGSVTIQDDSSGPVEVADIGGDFTVRHKDSGDIDYVRVAGKVSIPERD